jgi:hypothetical protein
MRIRIRNDAVNKNVPNHIKALLHIFFEFQDNLSSPFHTYEQGCNPDRFYADPDAAFHFNANPDPTFHFTADDTVSIIFIHGKISFD